MKCMGAWGVQVHGQMGLVDAAMSHSRGPRLLAHSLNHCFGFFTHNRAVCIEGGGGLSGARGGHPGSLGAALAIPQVRQRAEE